MPSELSHLTLALGLFMAAATITVLSYSSFTLLHNTLSTERRKLPTSIRLRSTTIDTSIPMWRSAHPIHTLTSDIKLSTGALDGSHQDRPAQCFLQFKRPIDAENEKYVERILGVKLRHHVPENAYIIYTSQANRLMRLVETDSTLRDVVHWIGRVKPEHKTMMDFSSLDLFNAGRDQHHDTTENALHASEATKHEEKTFKHEITLYAIVADRDLIDQDTVDEWKMQLSKFDGVAINSFDIRRASSSKLSVSINAMEHAQRVLQFLQQREQIMWIESALPLKMHDGGAKAIIQAGDTTSFDLGNSAILFKNGITGKDQLVTVGDTGIDHDMCFFHDPAVPTPVDTVNANHRKIVSYQRLSANIGGTIYSADDKDTVDGHGTHVAGSVAGSIPQSNVNASKLERFNGMAKDAKLVFLDILADDSPTLLIPDDLAENYFPLGYMHGARIHSNSWGCSMASLFTCIYDCYCVWNEDTQFGQKGTKVPERFCQTQFGTAKCCQACNQYNSQTQETDQFLHEHEDSVILFASGNDGTSSEQGSVTAPATAKNVITVGASMNNNDALVESVNHEDYSLYLRELKFTNTDQCCSYVDSDKQMERLVKSLCCPSYMRGQYEQNPKSYNQENIAAFSGRGPAVNGNRFKPDISAPGMKIQSMHSDGSLKTHQCGIGEPKLDNDAAILTMQGTSMATPVTAGAVALVRQYYMDGYYPTGEANKTDKMDPSGYLLKATILHAGRNQTGTVSIDDRSITRFLPINPNNYNGFGLLQLDSALKLKTVVEPERAIEMYVYDKQSLQNTDHTQKLCFAQNDGGTSTEHIRVRGTMVWYDPPSPVNANDDSILVNNLDLDGYVYDEVVKDAEYLEFYPGNGDTGGDDYNTVSQVRDVKVVDGQKVVFMVTGINLQRGPQNYALVVTGPKGLTPLPLEECPVVPIRPTRTGSQQFPWEVIGFVTLAILILVVVAIVIAFVIFVIYQRYRRAKALSRQSHVYDEQNQHQPQLYSSAVI